MTSTAPAFSAPSDTENTAVLFAKIADDLRSKGYSIQHQALPVGLSQQLYDCQYSLNDRDFTAAGIGRLQEYQQNTSVRNDEICWIDGTSDAGRNWLLWCDELKVFLNRQLFLGLFSFESHFAHYGPGNFYKRHTDAFNGQSNRMLSLVTYLNQDWQLEDGGELVIYQNDEDRQGINVLPRMGTIAIFLSEVFPHEVKPAKRDRYSVAGWFRINTTHGNKIDPPR